MISYGPFKIETNHPLNTRIRNHHQKIIRGYERAMDNGEANMKHYNSHIGSNLADSLCMPTNETGDFGRISQEYDVELMKDFIVHFGKEHNITAQDTAKPYELLERLRKEGHLQIHTLLGIAQGATTVITRAVLENCHHGGIHEPVLASTLYDLSESRENVAWLSILYSYLKSKKELPENDDQQKVSLLVKDMVGIQKTPYSSTQKVDAFYERLDKLIDLSSSFAMIYRPLDQIIISRLKTYKSDFDTEDHGNELDNFMSGKTHQPNELIVSVTGDFLDQSIQELQSLQKRAKANPKISILNADDFLHGTQEETRSKLKEWCCGMGCQIDIPSLEFHKPYTITYADLASLSTINFTGFKPRMLQNTPLEKLHEIMEQAPNYAKAAEIDKSVKALAHSKEP